MKKLILFFLILIFVSCEKPCDRNHMIADGFIMKDAYNIIGEVNLLNEYEAINDDGSINVVVEIPAGTLEKWEVNYKGNLKCGFKNGVPKRADYMAYPANYGMIPSTMSTQATGGDGDPTDVILLGEAIPKGSIVNAKLIGMLKLLDKGENNYKYRKGKVVKIEGYAEAKEAMELLKLSAAEFKKIPVTTR